MPSTPRHAGGLAGRTRESSEDPHLSYVFYRRRLPHWQPEGAPVFLTWHLKDSLPQHRYPPSSSPSAGRAFLWMDRFLDTTRTGPCWLPMAPVAALVVDAIAFGQDKLRHYEIGAFVVMPNHVHVLVIPRESIATLTRRLKGYTARQANRILGRTGEAFWQPESYDHWVRSEQEWGRIVRYIENNPVRAGLAARPEDYPWSSAAPSIAKRRQDCRRGAQDCALHFHTDAQPEM
jgi:REP element-mobilizing transposase RayT